VTSAPGASACPTSGGTSFTHPYDSVDRITDAGYGYDALGRTTASPGGVATAYYVTDLVQQQTAGAVRTSWTLDAAMRPRGWTTESNASGTWTATATRLNHYDGASDEPKWTVENTGTAAITRNVESLSSDLAATTAAAGGTVLQLTNLHGDVALQLPLDTAIAPTVLAADEYGNPRPGTPAARYGWLGAKQRSAETPTGMVLMGVRIYNPATGRFLQTDPIPGGSCNDTTTSAPTRSTPTTSTAAAAGPANGAAPNAGSAGTRSTSRWQRSPSSPASARPPGPTARIVWFVSPVPHIRRVGRAEA
jgi:RHS repeat-associated protein